jgi:Alginate lyase
MKPVGLAATQSIESFLFSDSTTFAHPGMLHTEADFARVREKVNASVSPWIEGFNLLSINDHAKTSWPLNPQVNVYRGYDGIHAENYAALYNDIAAAYQNALMWKITGDESHAIFAVRILDAWSSTMKFLGGTDDSQLAAGLYGYEFAQAAEIMRTYNGWPVANQTRFGTLLTSIFYPISYDFLIRHNNAGDSIYWANWDLCNIAGILSIGIFTDNTTMANQALDYFLTGPGTGRLNRTIWTTYMVDSQLMGQGQEASRDQGHSTLEFSLLGVIAQTAWNQGIDLFGYADNLILAGSEYTSKYNVGFDVPFTYLTAEMFNTPGFTFPMTVIGNASRGDVRPYGELLRAHYGDLKGLNTTWTDAYVEYVNNNTIQQGAAAGVEGGGGNYDPNSGGYDQLGFGTLMFRLKA